MLIVTMGVDNYMAHYWIYMILTDIVMSNKIERDTLLLK